MNVLVAMTAQITIAVYGDMVMRKSRLLDGAYILALILVLTLATGRSAWAAVWQPTNQDVNTLDFSLIISILPPGNFFVFDDGAANLQIAPNLQLASSDLLTFTQNINGTDWDITGTNGTLTVSNTTNFLFAESVGGVFSQESSASLLGPNNWRLVFGSGAQLQAVDVRPVPVPAAVWLFGSGLLGLVGIARRKKAA